MKQSLRKLFLPLLNVFERGEGAFSYKESHRTILVIMGCIFLLLSLGIAYLGVNFNQGGAIVPFIVFFGVAVTALVVGTLGSDRAVSKVWGTRR